MSRSITALALMAATIAAAAGASSGAPRWPAPPNPMRLARAAGLVPERAEQLQYHVHSHLDVFVNGKRVTIPAGIGINVKDPAVKAGTLADGSTAYGGISTPCAHPCISPLHTHGAYGVLHTETSKPQPNRLGQFFVEWGVRLDRRCVGGYCKGIQIYVNGKRFEGDPRQILLADRREIAIVVGTPPRTIPSTFPAVQISLPLGGHRGGKT